MALGIGSNTAIKRRSRSSFFFLVRAVLALTALVAVWIPAVRATRINLIDALRYE